MPEVTGQPERSTPDGSATVIAIWCADRGGRKQSNEAKTQETIAHKILLVR